MIAPNTVIPSFSVVAGRPGVVVDELPETAVEGLECIFYLPLVPRNLTLIECEL